MLCWVNGPFGVGKTTVATALARADRGIHLFDPETIGSLLRQLITEPIHDYQGWPAWRALVASTAIELHRHYGGHIVAPMSLLDQEYAEEIFNRLDAVGIEQLHVTLHAEPDELESRIEGDVQGADARRWRLAQAPRYLRALDWLGQDALPGGIIIDTTMLTRAGVAGRLREILGSSLGDRCSWSGH